MRSAPPRRLASFVPLALVALAGALGSSFLAGCSSGPDTSTPEGACEALTTALRGYLGRCAPHAETADLEELNEIQASCVYSSGLAGSGATPDALAGCATRVEGLSCGEDFEDACELEGTLAAGSPCVETAQCKAGRCVVPEQAATTTGCGTCVAELAEGANCSGTDVGCGRGLDCRDGTCVKEATGRAKVGQTCLDTVARPVVSVSCEAGAYCDVPEDGSFQGIQATCKKAVAGGGACRSSRVCEPTLGCVSGTCQAPAGAGSACTDERSCGRDVACADDKTCVAILTADPGKPCDDTRRCTSGSCVRSSAEAEGGVCTPYVEVDGACSPSGPRCRTPARCLAGRCKLPDAAACN